MRRHRRPPPEPIDMESADNPCLDFKKLLDLTLEGKVTKDQLRNRWQFQRWMKRAERPKKSFWWPFK